MRVAVVACSGSEIATFDASPSWTLHDVLLALPPSTLQLPGEKHILFEQAELCGDLTLAAIGAYDGAHLNLVVSRPQRVLTAAAGRTAKLWCSASGACLRTFQGHTGCVRSAAFSPCGRFVLTASNDHSARLWLAATGEGVRSFEGHGGWVSSAAFDEEGEKVLTASADGTARLWRVGGECVWSTAVQDEALWHAVFCERGALAACGNGTASLFDVTTGSPLLRFEGHEAAVKFVSAHGASVLTASADATARLWCLESGKCLRVYAGHGDSLNSAVFASDMVLTASSDCTARLWSTESGECLRIFAGHECIVRSAAFSSDGLEVLTASEDSTAMLWSADDGRWLRTFTGHVGTVFSAVFSH